jgi:hypothetical protein
MSSSNGIAQDAGHSEGVHFAGVGATGFPPRRVPTFTRGAHALTEVQPPVLLAARWEVPDRATSHENGVGNLFPSVWGTRESSIIVILNSRNERRRAQLVLGPEN